MPNAAQRAAMTQKKSKPGTAPAQTTKQGRQAAKAAIAEPETTPEGPQLTAATKVRGKSIRQLITGMIAQGKSTDEITEAVKADFPDSAAAAKPTKHIAFYRSRMKKAAGQPMQATGKKAATPAVEAPAPVAVTAEKGSGKRAAKKAGA